MGLWIFGPVADSILALPVLIGVSVVVLLPRSTLPARLWGVTTIGMVGFAICWLAFAAAGSKVGPLPIFVEPILGAGISAAAALVVLLPLRTGKDGLPWPSMLPGLTVVALVAMFPLVLGGGPVSTFAGIAGGELRATFADQSVRALPTAVDCGLRLVTAFCGLPILFLSVLLVVRRLPLGRCAALCLRGLARRPLEWIVAVPPLAVLGYLAFQVGTRSLWGESVTKLCGPRSVLLMIHSGLLVGIYVYFAARTVLVLTEDPAGGNGRPLFDVDGRAFPKRPQRP